MLRTFCRSKIHRATVTQAELHYEGSLGVDRLLLDAADIAPFERVQVVNINSGARLETYAIAEAGGSGTVCLNGAAARLGQPGDLVIIMCYALFTAEEVGSIEPRIVFVDDHNRIVYPGNELGPGLREG
ncbi:MAG: aspartate 1-decarboxylase [Chloroflexi bacterium]|nr:aspartate 1-decarboxylase [Chloroflexota bacterium]